jgi:hypothetical protein
VDQTVKSEASSAGGQKPAAGGRRGHGSRKEDWIAQNLRRVYDDALNEDIPQEMLDLLNALDDSEPDNESDKGTHG